MRIRLSATLTLTSLLLGLIGFSSPVDAEIFRFISPDGTVHYSNVPLDSRYRPFAPRPDVGFSKLRSPTKPDRAAFDRFIDTAAEKYRVDPALIRAVVKAESNYNPQAVSTAGALGLMQLMPRTAQDLSVGNPLDPEENIRGGVQYLRYLLNRFAGDTTLAVAAYHAGERNVDRHGGIPPIVATQEYVKRVLKFHQRYRDAMPASERAIYRVTAGDTVLYTTTPPGVIR